MNAFNITGDEKLELGHCCLIIGSEALPLGWQGGGRRNLKGIIGSTHDIGRVDASKLYPLS